MEHKKWLAWRHKGLGGSDTGAVLGISPYQTPFELWQEKTKRTPKDSEGNFATAKGQRMEPIARAKYELLTGKTYTPLMVENATFDYMRVTLDGINEEKTHLIEIKYVGKEFKTDIFFDKPHYRAQIQYQLGVCGVSKGTLIQINDSEEIHCTEVEADRDFIHETLFPAIKNFWFKVVTKEAPPLTAKDKIELNDSATLVTLKRMMAIKKKLDPLTEEYEALEAKVKELPKANYIFKFGKINMVERVGAVDYSKIPQLEGIDLDQYRKKSSVSMQVKFK